jgi:hypothetical protein
MLAGKAAGAVTCQGHGVRAGRPMAVRGRPLCPARPRRGSGRQCAATGRRCTRPPRPTFGGGRAPVVSCRQRWAERRQHRVLGQRPASRDRRLAATQGVTAVTATGPARAEPWGYLRWRGRQRRNRHVGDLRPAEDPPGARSPARLHDPAGGPAPPVPALLRQPPGASSHAQRTQPSPVRVSTYIRYSWLRSLCGTVTFPHSEQIGPRYIGLSQSGAVVVCDPESDSLPQAERWHRLPGQPGVLAAPWFVGGRGFTLEPARGSVAAMGLWGSLHGRPGPGVALAGAAAAYQRCTAGAGPTRSRGSW